MSEQTLSQIFEFLKSKGIEYKHLTHPHVHTSQEAANIRGTRIEQAAKAIILKVKGRDGEYEFIQCVLPGHRKIDLASIRKARNAKGAGLATPEEVLEKTGCTIGSVPPLGNLFNMQVIADKSLLEEEYIVFSSGTHFDSVMMKSQDFLEAVNPALLDFCVPL